MYNLTCHKEYIDWEEFITSWCCVISCLLFVSMKKSTLCDAFVAESLNLMQCIHNYIHIHSCTYMCTRNVITVKSLHNNNIIATGFYIYVMYNTVL